MPPFVVRVQAPPVAVYGEVLEISVEVLSRLDSSERLRLTVALNENFLVAGSTACSIDVPCRANVSTVLSVVPLRCGVVALPPVSLSWERAGQAPVKVLDTKSVGGVAGGVAEQKVVFIRPATASQ